MIIDGKYFAGKVKQELKEEISQSLFPPCLAVIYVGNNKASETYVRNKRKACEEIGMVSKIFQFDENSSEAAIKECIEELNADKDVHGIILQLPLPSGFSEKPLINAISVEKDVDGLTFASQGRLYSEKDCFVPCTPKGILYLLEECHVPLSGKHVVMIGRSNLVGKPLATVLSSKRYNATVTLCNSKTENLKELCLSADVVICAVGKEKLLTADMVRNGATVIDVGINRNSEGKLCGDADFEALKEKVFAITPVPGGVGQMTVAMLLKNTVEAWKKRKVKLRS